MKWFINLPMWARFSIGLAAIAGMFLLVWRLHAAKQAREPVWADGAAVVEWEPVELTLKV